MELSLALLEQAIEHGYPSLWLAYHKALALRQMGDLAGAIGVWSELVDVEGMPGFTEKVATQLETTEQQLADQKRAEEEALLNGLHAALADASRAAAHIPTVEAWSEELDLQALILKEAIAARNDGAVELSLALLEQAIEHGCSSLWFVHHKALALRQMGDLAGAIGVWSELVDVEGMPGFTEKVATQLETTEQQLADQKRAEEEALLNGLHAALADANRGAVHIPTVEAWSEELDLQALILKEAIAARNDGEVELSLALLEQAIEHGCSSLWFVHHKALALRQMGDLAGAIGVWSELVDVEGMPGFTEKVATQLETTEKQLADQKRAEEEALLNGLHAALADTNRVAAHIPTVEAWSEELDLQALILKEAIAARNDGEVELSLALLEQAIEHGYPSLWLVHHKALALRQMGDLAGAIGVWSELVDVEGMPGFTEKVATQLETTEQQLADQKRAEEEALLNGLHAALADTNRVAAHIPTVEAWSEELDLQALILKEAIAARNDGAVELSLALLEQAIEHGYPSLWLAHHKALALRQMGDLAGAIGVWSELVDVEGMPGFTEKVATQLETTEQQLADQKRAEEEALLNGLHAALADTNRVAAHIPTVEAWSEELDLQALILKEAIAARNDGAVELSLALLEQAIEHGYPSLWLGHHKALALRQMGDLAGAIGVWSELVDVEGMPGFTEKVATQLETTRAAIGRSEASRRGGAAEWIACSASRYKPSSGPHPNG